MASKTFRKRKFGLPGYKILDDKPVMAQSQTYGWGQSLMNLQNLHAKGFVGRGVRIAVIDLSLIHISEPTRPY